VGLEEFIDKLFEER